MKIVALTAENVKRLVAVEIRPDGNLVQITGKNGQGKTSVLDAIWWALEGATHIQTAPIRKGAAEARIRLDLGELVVTRKFKAKEEGGYTTTITVESADGARYPSPQKVLDDLIGHLAFDPLAFTRLKPADQVEQLKAFAPGVDFEAIERANKKDFEERTSLNRRAKDMRAQADGIALPPGPPQAAIDETALVAKLEQAGQHNSDIERRKANRERLSDEAADLELQGHKWKAEADGLLARIQQLRDEAAALDAQAAEKREKLKTAPPLPEPIDTAAVRDEIDAAKVVNATGAARARKLELTKMAGEREAEAKALTDAIDKRDAEKRAAIAAAKMPVDGLGFGDGVVLLDGLPFDQASDAMQLRASIAIAAAMNPKLRVIRVRDGSLLDEDAMRLLAEFADANDLQVWIERVDSTGKVGFVLEDGQVRGQTPPATTAPAATTEAA